MTLPPTIYRRSPGPGAPAPFVLIVVHADRDFAEDSVRHVVAAWADSDANVVGDWYDLAKEVLFVTDTGLPYCTPHWVYVGQYRWGAIVREGRNEVHVYVGLRTAGAPAPSPPKAVIERATDLISRLRHITGWDGARKVALRITAELYERGEQTGRHFVPPRSYLEVLSDLETLKEGAAALLITAAGGI